MNSRMRIVVLAGGPSPEADVSRSTGRAVCEALRRRGHEARVLEAIPEILCGLNALDVDCVFLATHGSPGEDGTLQGLLEIAAMPYTGSGVLASALAMDKVATRRMIADLPVAVNAWQTVTLDGVERWRLPAEWSYPLIIKPAAGGSSLGTARVEDETSLRAALYDALRFGDQVMVEPFLVARELTVGLLDDEIIGDMEVIAPGSFFDPQAKRFYDFRAKYVGSETRYVTNPDLPADVRTAIREGSSAVCRRLGTEGPARVDWLWVPGRAPVFLEVNTIPGMTDHSLLPKMAAAAGMPFEELCERIAWGARTKC